MGRVHRILRWIIFTVGGVVGVLTLLVLAGPNIRSRQMERAIARFEKRPSQGRANTLVELLKVHAATDEQGKRALALLLRPRIVTRKAYASGQIITIGIERPFDLNFHKFLWSKDAITINGLPAGSDTLERETSCLDVPISYTQPGTYPLELRIQGSVGIERTSRSTTLLSHLHDSLPWLIPAPGAWQPSLPISATSPYHLKSQSRETTPLRRSNRYRRRSLIKPCGRHSPHATLGSKAGFRLPRARVGLEAERRSSTGTSPWRLRSGSRCDFRTDERSPCMAYGPTDSLRGSAVPVTSRYIHRISPSRCWAGTKPRWSSYRTQTARTGTRRSQRSGMARWSFPCHFPSMRMSRADRAPVCAVAAIAEEHHAESRYE